jgi:hypothetical protein
MDGADELQVINPASDDPDDAFLLSDDESTPNFQPPLTLTNGSASSTGYLPLLQEQVHCHVSEHELQQAEQHFKLSKQDALRTRALLKVCCSTLMTNLKEI